MQRVGAGRWVVSLAVCAGAAYGVVSCCKQEPAQPSVAPTATEGPVATVAPVTTESPVPPQPTATESAPVEPVPTASATAAPMGAELRPGVGSCKVDGDCTLGVGARGCCIHPCIATAVNAKQEAADSAWNERACRTKKCPPPAPCRITHRAVAALCRDGRCMTQVEPVALADDDPGY